MSVPVLFEDACEVLPLCIFPHLFKFLVCCFGVELSRWCLELNPGPHTYLGDRLTPNHSPSPGIAFINVERK